MRNPMNNEFLNRFLRRGEGAAVITGHPSIEHIVDRQRRVLQEGPWVPLDDAYRAIAICAQRLLDVSATNEEVVIGVDRDTLERLLLGLLRIESVQPALIDPKPSLPERIEGERKLVRGCHAAATSIASTLAKAPRTTFEAYADLVARSPDAQTTLRVLAHAGRPGPGLVDSHGPLMPIDKLPPATLPAGGLVSLRVRVHRVDDRTNVAVVENLQSLDDDSSRLLSHHANECELMFDGGSVERADLTAAQYLDAPIRIRCAAECAVLPSQARKSSLTLERVLEARDVMDEMHRTARQYQQRLCGEET
jgi:hypothetical protein